MSLRLGKLPFLGSEDEFFYHTGCSGGNRFLYGGSAYAQRAGYLLRVVLYPVGESEGLSGRNHARMVKNLKRFEKAWFPVS